MGARLRKAISDYGLTANATNTVVTCDHRPTAVAVALRLGPQYYTSTCTGPAIWESITRYSARVGGAVPAEFSQSVSVQPTAVWNACAASVAPQRGAWPVCFKLQYGRH